MKAKNRGEIVTILTIATFIILGISTLVSSVFLSNKNSPQTTKTKAEEWHCPGGNCDKCGTEGPWADCGGCPDPTQTCNQCSCDPWKRIQKIDSSGNSHTGYCTSDNKWCGDDCRIKSDLSSLCTLPTPIHPPMSPTATPPVSIPSPTPTRTGCVSDWGNCVQSVNCCRGNCVDGKCRSSSPSLTPKTPPTAMPSQMPTSTPAGPTPTGSRSPTPPPTITLTLTPSTSNTPTLTVPVSSATPTISLTSDATITPTTPVSTPTPSQSPTLGEKRIIGIINIDNVTNCDIITFFFIINDRDTLTRKRFVMPFPSNQVDSINVKAKLFIMCQGERKEISDQYVFNLSNIEAGERVEHTFNFNYTCETSSSATIVTPTPSYDTNLYPLPEVTDFFGGIHYKCRHAGPLTSALTTFCEGGKRLPGCSCNFNYEVWIFGSLFANQYCCLK